MRMAVGVVVVSAAGCVGATRPGAATPAPRSPLLGIPAFYTLGVSTHHIDLGRRTVTGVDAAGRPASESAAPMGAFQGETFDSDIGLQLGPAYFGLETQFGGGTIAHPLRATVAARGGTSEAFGVSGGGPLAGAGLVGGLALPHLGMLAPQLELYAGVAAMFLTPDAAATYPCDPDGCQVPGVATWIVEPRLRVRGWMWPHVSLDAWGGVGVGPSRGDWSVGVAATLHVLPFGGSERTAR